MVAERDAVDAAGNELALDVGRDAGARRGVLGVHHDQVQLLLRDEARHRADDDLPPGFADYVADEKKSQGWVRSTSLPERSAARRG